MAYGLQPDSRFMRIIALPISVIPADTSQSAHDPVGAGEATGTTTGGGGGSGRGVAAVSTARASLTIKAGATEGSV